MFNNNKYKNMDYGYITDYSMHNMKLHIHTIHHNLLYAYEFYFFFFNNLESRIK